MISFVIPAYNAEKYLERALSPFEKTKEQADKFEVLVVENGSTDRSVEMLNELAQKMSFLRVLHSEKGVSNARNMGIENAKGEWIAFVDADDYLCENALEQMVSDAENLDVDLYVYSYEAGNKNVVHEYKRNTGVNVEQVRIEMLENPTRCMQVWAKLYRKELMDQNHIRFNANMKLSEDSDFTLRYTKFCQCIQFSSDITYHYSIDNVSTMRTFNGDKVYDYEKALLCTKESLETESEKIKNAFEKYILMHLNIALVRDVFCVQNKKNIFHKIRQMKQIVRNELYWSAIQKTRIAECKSFRMMPILCMKLHFNLGAGFIYWVRAVSNARKEKG